MARATIGPPDALAVVPLVPCCVMVTVPASQLISPVTDRMPAILGGDDWSVWLEEESAEMDEVKSALRTVEGVNEEKGGAPLKPDNAQGDLL